MFIYTTISTDLKTNVKMSKIKGNYFLFNNLLKKEETNQLTADLNSTNKAKTNTYEY